MSKMLFRMRDVPDDEAEEVRDILKAHDIEYFETFAGNWGISMPAIWVQNPDQFTQARELLDSYENTRAEKSRLGYEQKLEQGEVKSTRQLFLDRPFQFIAYWLLIVIVVFISIYYFFNL
jgi:hypothetical protein